MSLDKPLASAIFDRRLSAVHATIRAAADELVLRGAIGVGARLHFPRPEGTKTLVVASGHSDRERAASLQGHELFAVASQSKMFTAAAVLLLIKEGRIQLSDHASKYVPEATAVDSSATVEQYLNHTSGIGNFIHAITALPHPWPSFSFDDLMALARLQGKQFSAGSRFDYNNTDVVVLARLCERVTGQTFDELLAERIFRPLGLESTFVAVAGASIPRSRMARGYYQPAPCYEGAPVDVSGLPDYSIASAAGNIVSSLEDMCRWMEGLRGGPNGIGLALSDFVASIVDSGTSGSHWFFPKTYGRGVESWRWGGRSVWGHRGSFFGYHSGTFLEPKSGLIFSMAMTMCTQGSLMRFIDLQGHDYMSFMETCCLAGVDALSLP